MARLAATPLLLCALLGCALANGTPLTAASLLGNNLNLG